MDSLFRGFWPSAAPALLVLVIFYGIYFTKKLAQKRRGIQTRQIGRRKERGVHTVEMLMSVATLGAPIAQLLSIGFGWSYLPKSVGLIGFCIGILGDIIFLLSVLCMGFDLQYVGVLLMYGNLLNLGFSLFAIVMLHLQILQEERYLANTFGAPYLEYRRRVFRYLGRR